MAKSQRKLRSAEAIQEQAEPAKIAPDVPRAAEPPMVAGEPYTGPSLAKFAGAKAARGWAERLLRDLADYKSGGIRWEDVDRGAVLCGPTGTGKTTLVRAIAAASGLPLIVTSYRDWMSLKEGHLGNLLQAMQDVFAKAIGQRPCIVFIDELDSLPARSGAREHKDWYIGIVNALLEHLDGGMRREGVVVIGACNDPSRLDPALVRPGRLERKIAIDLPSIEEIAEILEFHVAGSVPRPALGEVAVLVTGASGAQLEALVREARRAARHDGRSMTAADLKSAALGPGDGMPADLLRRTAVHEAGHAFAALRFGVARSVAVSLVRRDDSLGATRIERIVQGQTREVIDREIAVHLAGRAAEDAILGSVSSGAGGGEDSDLARATAFAIRVVASYGLSAAGGLVWHGEAIYDHLLLSQPKLHAEVHAILDRCYGLAKDLVEREREPFGRLVDALVERRGLDHAEIARIIGETPGAPAANH